MPIANWQKTLELDPNGHYSNDDYKKQYRLLAHKYHPDKNNGDDTKFKEIQDAYEHLTGKRKSHTPPPQDSGFNPFNVGFDFSDFFTDVRRSWGQANRNVVNRPPSNDNQIGLTFELSLNDVKAGKVLGFLIKKSKDCDKCQGKCGDSKERCKKCEGKGSIRQVQSNGLFTVGYDHVCADCSGLGETIVNPCKACGAKGFVEYEERINVEVKKV